MPGSSFSPSLWTALVTPFSQQGTVCFQDLEKLLRRQEEVGLGVVLFGSTGEGISLSCGERQEILKFVCALKLSIPLMVTVPGVFLQQSLEWVEFTRSYPVHSYLLTCPVYTKPGIEGQITWFKTLMDRVQKPCFLYNNPFRSAVPLSVQAVQALAMHPYFAGIKDSGASLNFLMDYRSVCPKSAIFCGDDPWISAMAPYGAAGLISVISNLLPSLSLKHVQQSLTGHSSYTDIWWKVNQFLSGASNPIPIKRALKEMGLMACDSVRLPLSQKDFLYDEQGNDFLKNLLQSETV
ncbi:MAG: 4-hydroxy-tetrahydrodipicolinate synthase [Alphaproteobacteria bacterium 40-19]|nr:MAG: 4-hydroxy-tetrahydrodipicolinate synthase [Alphaproteobacteria bacterium 40-19]